MAETQVYERLTPVEPPQNHRRRPFKRGDGVRVKGNSIPGRVVARAWLSLNGQPPRSMVCIVPIGCKTEVWKDTWQLEHVKNNVH